MSSYRATPRRSKHIRMLYTFYVDDVIADQTRLNKSDNLKRDN